MAAATAAYVRWTVSDPYLTSYYEYDNWSPVYWLNWHPSAYVSMWALALLLRKSRPFLLGVIAWSVLAALNCLAFAAISPHLWDYGFTLLWFCAMSTAQYVCMAVLLAACLMLRVRRPPGWRIS